MARSGSKRQHWLTCDGTRDQNVGHTFESRTTTSGDTSDRLVPSRTFCSAELSGQTSSEQIDGVVFHSDHKIQLKWFLGLGGL